MTNNKKRNTPVWPVDESGKPVYDAMAALVLNDDELVYEIFAFLQSHGFPVKIQVPQVCGGASSVAVNVPADRVQEARDVLRNSEYKFSVIG